MPATASLLILLQALGAVIGTGAALWAELSYLHALHHGHISDAERRHLHRIAHGLRFGMTLILLASLGLSIEAFRLNMAPQPLFEASYWMLMFFALIVIAATVLLSRERLSFSFGSALVFSGWWFLVYLTLGKLPVVSFSAAAAFYLVAVFVFYGLLSYIRFLHTHQK